MNLIYSSRAKDELAKVDWRLREGIIKKLDLLFSSDDPMQNIIQLEDETLYKVVIDDYIMIGSINQDEFTALSIIKKQVIKLPTE